MLPKKGTKKISYNSTMFISKLELFKLTGINYKDINEEKIYKQKLYCHFLDYVL